MTTPFDLRTRREGAALVVTLSGGVQIDQGDEFQERLLELLCGSAATLIIDLTRLEFMGSAGIAAIVAAHAKAAALGGAVHLVSPTAALRRLMELLRIPAVIPIHPTLEAAIRSVG